MGSSLRGNLTSVMLFAIYNAALTLGPSQARGATEGINYIENAIAFFDGVTNFEAIVTEWWASFPRVESDRAEVASYETRIITRVHYDKKNDKYLVVRRQAYEIEESERKKFKFEQALNTSIICEAYDSEDGATILPFKPKRHRKISFETYCRVIKLPMVPYFGLRYPLNMGAQRDNTIENLLRKATDATSRVHPDGSASVNYEIHPGKPDTARVKIVFDGRSLLPKEHISSAFYRGEWIVAERLRTEYEEKNGNFRPVRVDFERLDGSSRPSKPDEIVPIDSVGNVQIEWLQFNEQELKFPETSEIGETEVEWAKYLKIID